MSGHIENVSWKIYGGLFMLWDWCSYMYLNISWKIKFEEKKWNKTGWGDKSL